jgi:hypothetical protein
MVFSPSGHGGTGRTVVDEEHAEERAGVDQVLEAPAVGVNGLPHTTTHDTHKKLRR